MSDTEKEKNILECIDLTKDFIQEHAPLLVKEFLSYKVFMCNICLVFCLVLCIVFLILAFKFYSLDKQDPGSLSGLFFIIFCISFFISVIMIMYSFLEKYIFSYYLNAYMTHYFLNRQ